MQQLRGEGFTRPPSAKQQATMSSSALTTAATGWARELKAAGVNVNLAPVADTVPADIGRANEPIGKYERQYGSDPETVGGPRRRSSRGCWRAASRDGQALPRAGPDPQQHRLHRHRHHRRRHRPPTTPTSSRSGGHRGRRRPRHGRVGSYSRSTPAAGVFSAAIVTDLLRGDLGYDGVVITDDVGARPWRRPRRRAGRAVHRRRRRHHPDRRARRPAMTRPQAKAAADPAFAAGRRVGHARADPQARMGLVPCSAEG